MRLYLILLMLFVLSANQAFSWGSMPWGDGHRIQTEMVFKHLPEKIKSRFSKQDINEMIRHYSHYPDSNEAFGDLSDETRALLGKYGIKKRFDLHFAKGQAVSFIILTEFFKKKDYHQAAVWLASICHSLGDAGAANHHPVLHYYLRAFPLDKEIKLVNGESLRKYNHFLSGAFPEKPDKKILNDILKEYKPKLLVEPGDNMGGRALAKFLDIDYLVADIMSEKSGMVMDGFLTMFYAKTDEERAKGRSLNLQGWTNLCVEPAKLIMDAIYTSHFLAEQGIVYTVEDMKAALKKHKVSFREKIVKRPLELDSTFKHFLKPYTGQKADVMVLVEPTYTMYSGQLGFMSKYYAAAAMLHLKENNIPYVSIDVRSLYEKDLPLASEIPVLVIASRKTTYGFSRFKAGVIDEKVAKYLDSGGKVIQIGQGIMKSLVKIFQAKSESKEKKYFPYKKEDAVGSMVALSNIDGLAGNIVRTITATPFTPSTSNHPNVRSTIQPGADGLVPFATLKSADGEFIIGAFQKNNKGELNAAFIPELILSPFTYKEKTLRFPGRAEFDTMGESIFLAVLKQLQGQKIKKNPMPSVEKTNSSDDVVVTEMDFTKLKLAPSEKVAVKAEKSILKPVMPRSYSKGTRLKHLQTIEPGVGTTAPGALIPESVKVSQKGKVLELDKDFFLDKNGATLGWGEGKIKAKRENEVEVDYEFYLLRLDSIIERPDGKKVLRTGKSHLTAPKAPELKEGEKRLGNLFITYGSDGTNCEFFPVLESSDKAVTLTKSGMIPKTMAKIKAGGPVKIVCWGDSVTNGGDATKNGKYTTVFEKRLKEKFPKANIDVEVVAVGGSNSRQWLYPDKFKHSRRQEQCNWNRIVKAKPDLVTIEFVNDGPLRGKSLNDTYSEILKRLSKLNAEVIIISPHFTSMKSMKFKTLRDKERRSYVKSLREFVKSNKIAFADASSRWEHLWKEGIPYITYLQNAINHPDDVGHAIFADELIKCFEN